MKFNSVSSVAPFLRGNNLKSLLLLLIFIIPGLARAVEFSYSVSTFDLNNKKANTAGEIKPISKGKHNFSIGEIKCTVEPIVIRLASPTREMICSLGGLSAVSRNGCRSFEKEVEGMTLRHKGKEYSILFLCDGTK